MEWSDAIEESLPAPRDDEPADLRRDIADELGDHLACAVVRERRHTEDDDAAKEAALERFGCPRTIARRLWWDQMKERIMSQRLTLTAAVTAAVACLGVIVLSWMTFERMRDVDRQTREVNLAIMAKLEALAAPQPVQAPESLGWTEARFRLVQGNVNGPPAERFRVVLFYNPADQNNLTTLQKTSGTDGVVEFGPLRPGTYTYNVNSPWNQQSNGYLIAPTGPQTQQTIVCPHPQEEESVIIELKWPDELKEALKEHKNQEVKDLWVQCTFGRRGLESQSKQLGEHIWMDLGGSFGATVKSDGELVEGQEVLTVWFQDFQTLDMNPPAGWRVLRVDGLDDGEPAKAIVDLKEGAPAEHVKWPVGEYYLNQVVLLSHETDPHNPDREVITAVAGHSSYGQLLFHVNAGEKNVWTIELPVIELNPKQRAAQPAAARLHPNSL